MTEPNHTRGNALRGRSLSEVTEALSRVRDAALERALDPKNAAKGPWRVVPVGDLLDMLRMEVDELELAIGDGEPLPRILSEAGDVVWTVAMLIDRVIKHHPLTKTQARMMT